MTKNRSMRIAVLVLALALITCCFVGTTFAKYTSTATGTSAEATVAQWSFMVDDTTNIATTNSFTFDPFTTISDDSTPTGADDENVYNGIAPGTGGYAQIKLTNSSDVRAEYVVTFAATTTLPLEYSINGTDGWTKEIGTLELTAELGEDESANAGIYWRWAFADDTATNASDTALGVAGTAKASITATVVASQVD